MSLGSSIGNFSRHESAAFVRDCADAAGEQGAVLIGIDSCLDPKRVHQAYNDSEDLTRQFTLNGLKHANLLLKSEVFDLNIWDALGRYDQGHRRHQAFVFPKQTMNILGIEVQAGQEIRIEESYKYSKKDLTQLWRKAQVKPACAWFSKRGDYGE